MENQNISSTCMPLLPPYQIIKYGHDIGMQIGTLILTKLVENDEKHSFRIETHSYPIVAYENKETIPQNKSLFSHNFMEGVVWNRVELKKVSTVCFCNSHLSWSEFVNILWDDNDRFPKTYEIQRFMFNILPKYGVSIDRPQPREYIMHLYTDVLDGMPTTIKSRRDDCFALNVEWSEDVDALAGRIIGMYNDLRVQKVVNCTKKTFLFL